MSRAGAYVQELLVDLLQHDVHAGDERGGSDAAAHETAAQHRHRVNGPRLEARIRDALHLQVEDKDVVQDRKNLRFEPFIGMT